MIDVVRTLSTITCHVCYSVWLQGETRLGIIRGRMKKTAAGLTPVVFHLEEGACERRVARLLLDCQFVYPGDVEVSIRICSGANIDKLT